jgi:DNA-binding CsgD family transcriptional regulator
MEVGTNAEVFGGAAAGEAQEGLGAGLALLMDELAHGVMVVNLEGKLLHANQAARQELARRALAGVATGRWQQALRSDEAKPLQDALQKAGDGKRSLVTVALGSGAPLAMAVIPLKSDDSIRRAALVFSRASVCDALMLCFFARSHGLTHTEEHVLGILCQGYSAPEIARQMKVAVSTVRSHVRSLCAKTRSSGVRELVKRVSVLPPVAPSLRLEPVH